MSPPDMERKLREACAQAKAFGEANPGKKMECFNSLMLHGMAEGPNGPEGSKQWSGLYDPKTGAHLSETFLKSLEREYLGGYDYVVGFTIGCYGGAMVA